MTQPNAIADFVLQHYVQPARQRGQRRFTIRAGDVHARMGPQASIPAICAALGSRELAQHCNVRLATRDGSDDATAAFVYELRWTEEEVREFTRKPLLAVLATTYPSGGPQAIPVWYDYDGTHFRVTTTTNLPKIRNIQKDPRVALVVMDTSHHNFDKLVVRGRAELTTEGAQEVTILHAQRYLGLSEETRKSLERYKRQTNRVLIKITPEKYL